MYMLQANIPPVHGSCTGGLTAALDDVIYTWTCKGAILFKDSVTWLSKGTTEISQTTPNVTVNVHHKV